MVAEKYGVTYPLFAKVDVNGPSAHPIFKFLKSFDNMGEDIGWNFVKVSRLHTIIVQRTMEANPLTFLSLFCAVSSWWIAQGNPSNGMCPPRPMATLARKPILTHQTFHADSDQH